VPKKTDNTAAERQRRYKQRHYVRETLRLKTHRLFEQLNKKVTPYELFDRIEEDLTNLFISEGSTTELDDEPASQE